MRIPIQETTNFWDKAAAIYLAKRLNVNINNVEAFKLGLIDRQWRVIKEPRTATERNAMGSFDRVIFMIRRHVPDALLKPLSFFGVLKILAEGQTSSEDTKKDELEYLYRRFVSEACDRGISLNALSSFLNERRIENEKTD